MGPGHNVPQACHVSSAAPLFTACKSAPHTPPAITHIFAAATPTIWQQTKGGNPRLWAPRTAQQHQGPLQDGNGTILQGRPHVMWVSLEEQRPGAQALRAHPNQQGHGWHQPHQCNHQVRKGLRIQRPAVSGACRYFVLAHTGEQPDEQLHKQDPLGQGGNRVVAVLLAVTTRLHGEGPST